jgi:hypothetical protein
MKYRVIWGMFFSILVADTEEEAIGKAKKKRLDGYRKKRLGICY